MTVFPEESYEEQEFDGVDATEADVSGRTFFACVFRGCSFSEAGLSKSLFDDCRFEDCHFSLTEVSGCRFQQVRFKECRFSGVNFSTLNDLILDMGFEKCSVVHSSFVQMNLENLKMTGSQIKDCDFHQAKLKGADFSGSNLEGSVFEATDLTRADFRGAENYRINPQGNTLKHARFSMPEAIALLQALGVKVEF